MSDTKVQLPDGMTADDARDVLREYARTDEAQIINNDTLEALREEIAEAKETFAAVLSEESPQSAETLARQDMDALTEPFRDDEGDIDVDTLRQDPQTGDTGGDGGDGSGGSDAFDADAVGFSVRDDLDTLERKRRKFESMGIESRVDAIESEMVDLAEAPDFETLQKEVL